MEKPATFINRPLTRSQLRKRFMRTITKDEIEFRNAHLMVKFLNPNGKLLNRYQTRLATPVQRKVARVIKKMRHLGLLPFVGALLPTDKISLGQWIDEVEEMHKKTIDPVTGRMYLRHSLQDDARDRFRRNAARVDERTSYFGDYETEETSEQEKERLKLIRDMSLDVTQMVPNRAQREWLTAQAQVLANEGAIDELERIAEDEGRAFISPDLVPAGAATAHKNVTERYAKITDDPLKTGENLAEDLLHEKALELSRFHEKVKTPKEKMLQGNYTEPTMDHEQNIRRRIDSIMSFYAENRNDDFHLNESVSKQGRRVKRPKLREPEVI